ncbi:hypothetical protein [Hydrogenophaga sp. R2]|uniref:hypothetical protein n=1 Tax=Hydrogenophaga sp. R2 TaxID=3132827 RepID=UPI003CEB4EF5
MKLHQAVDDVVQVVVCVLSRPGGIEAGGERILHPKEYGVAGGIARMLRRGGMQSLELGLQGDELNGWNSADKALGAATAAMNAPISVDMVVTATIFCLSDIWFQWLRTFWLKLINHVSAAAAAPPAGAAGAPVMCTRVSFLVSCVDS